MGIKMNLRIITKNHAGDPEIGCQNRFSQNRFKRPMAAQWPYRQRGS